MFPIVPILEAQEYHRTFSGRTKPVFFRCGNDGGSELAEVIVKLKSGIDSGESGLSAELLSNLMASALGLDAPQPVLVNISQEFAESVDHIESGQAVKSSIGLNYGSRYIGGGYGTWPQHKSIPAILEPKAAEILTFDALIQNPDRREDNPNLLWKGDEIYIIDHEMAFSFMRLIGQPKDPWTKDGFFNCIQNHVFYSQLKGKELQLDRFIGAFEAVTLDAIKSLNGLIPAQWQSDKSERMVQHLLLMREKSAKFTEELRRAMI